MPGVVRILAAFSTKKSNCKLDASGANHSLIKYFKRNQFEPSFSPCVTIRYFKRVKDNPINSLPTGWGEFDCNKAKKTKSNDKLMITKFVLINLPGNISYLPRHFRKRNSC